MGCDGIWERYVNDSQPMITRLNGDRRGTDNSTVVKNLLDSLVASDTSEEIGCDNMSAILIEFL